jgi:hypothetical protein
VSALDPKIMDRLVKLMQMAERGTEHEAGIAAQRAAELLAKHQLDMADVQGYAASGLEPKVEKGRIDGEDVDDATSLENWHRSLLSAIADALGARPFFRPITKKKATFWIIGPADSVSSARYLYMSISRQINKMSRAAMREHGETQNAWRRSYAMGMVTRVWERLKAGRAAAMSSASTTAMVWVDKTKVAIQKEYANLGKMRDVKQGKRKRRDASDYGYMDGEKVDVGGKRDSLGAGQARLKS